MSPRALLLTLLLAAPAVADPWLQAFRAASRARDAGDLAASREALARARAAAGESWLGRRGLAPDGRLPATLAAQADLERAAGDPKAALELDHQLLQHRRAHPHPGGHALQAQLRRVARQELAHGSPARGATLAREALAWSTAGRHRLDDLEHAEAWTLRVELGSHRGAPLAPAERLTLLRDADVEPRWAPFAGETELRLRLHRALARLEPDAADRGFHAARVTALATSGDPDEALAWVHLHAVGRAAARGHDLARAATWLRRASEAADAAPLERADSLVALARLSEVCHGCALPNPLELLRRAHELRRGERGPFHPTTLDAWAARARHLARQRGESEPLRAALVQLATVRSRAGDQAGACETHLELADLARQAGDVSSTLLHLGRARDAARVAAPTPTSPAGAQRIEKVAFRLAATQRALGRHDEEAATWESILPDLAQAYGPGHRRHAWRQLSLAEARERAGKPAVALAAARRALAALREAGPALALEYALDLVARLEQATGDPSAADHRAEALAWARAQDPLATSG